MPRIDELEKLLAADPRDAFVLYAIAQEHAKGGAHGLALEFYAKCLEADPTYAYAYFHAARSREAMGDRTGAVETLRRGVAAARAAGDQKAWSEMQGYLDELE